MRKTSRGWAAALLTGLIIITALGLGSPRLRKVWLPSSHSSGKLTADAPNSAGAESAPLGTVAPGVHFLNNLGPAAAYVVETSDGLVLIDSGLESNGAAITRDFRYRKLDLNRLRAILLTHAHGDHSLGARYLRQTTGAKVYAGRDDSGVLRAGGPREAFFSAFDMWESQPHPTEVDVELTGGETIAVGDAQFQVIAAPGHTPGSICYSLERGALHILFSGDVIMTVGQSASLQSPSLQSPRANPLSLAGQELGTYAAYLGPRYRGDAEAFRTTLRRLAELPVPDLVLPGHPQAESPVFRINKAHWKAMLEQGVQDMTTLLARYQADGRNFLDGTPKQLMPGLYYLGDLSGFSLYGLKTSSGLIVFNAAGGPNLVPFLESKIQDLGIKPAKITTVLLTSCDPDALSGVRDLVTRTGCKVVAPEAGLGVVKEACPAGTKLLTCRELEQANWFPVQTLFLEGRGIGAAYLVKWLDKQVLITGRIPIKPSRSSEEELYQSLSSKHANPTQYRQDLDTLSKIKPDLWLPLVSVHGQNANLYQDEWQETLKLNGRLLDPVDPRP
jgi:glyoxylase-like metal-dependent hydrolase (beta-lactamase superfamily II)